MIESASEKVIDEIYAAALDVSHWPKALHSLARIVNGAGAVLLPCTAPAAVLNFTSHDLVEGAKAYVQDEWWRYDAPLAYTLQNGVRSGFYADTDIIPPETLRSHPFFNDFLKRYGSGRVTSVLSTPVPGHTVAITTHREAWRGDMTDDERRTYRALGHHASRAAAISISLATLAARTEDLASALDEVPGGVAILDGAGQVLYASGKLNKLNRLGLKISLKRVILANAQLQAMFDAMVESAVAPGIRASHDFLLLERPAPDRPVMLRIIPVSGRPTIGLQDYFRTKLVMLMAIDLNIGSDPLLVRGFQALGLTLAEARLAAIIGTGKSPREASVELGIKEGTARMQLKQVFSKLDIHRQGELTAIATRMNLA